jgi:hypothetical protein
MGEGPAILGIEGTFYISADDYMAYALKGTNNIRCWLTMVQTEGASKYQS